MIKIACVTRLYDQQINLAKNEVLARSCKFSNLLPFLPMHLSNCTRLLTHSDLAFISLALHSRTVFLILHAFSYPCQFSCAFLLIYYIPPFDPLFVFNLESRLKLVSSCYFTSGLMTDGPPCSSVAYTSPLPLQIEHRICRCLNVFYALS